MADYTRTEPDLRTIRLPLRRPWRNAPNFVRPQAFAEGPAALAVAAICAGALVPIFLADMVTPSDVTVSVLVVFPVIAAAWLVPARPAAAVAAAAILLQLILGVTAQLTWPTVAANSAAVGAICAIGHSASINSHDLRQSREHQLSLLLAAARALSSSTELQTVLENIVEATASFITYGNTSRRVRATVWRVSDNRLEAICEFDRTGFSMVGPRLPIGEQLQKAIQADEVVTFRADELPPEMRELYRSAGVDSLALAPVRVAGQLYCLLSSGSRDQRRFSVGELRLLEGIADLASLAIANAQKLESERLRTRVFQALHGVATELARSASPNELCNLVVERACQLAEADAAVLGLKEEGTAVLRVVADSPETKAFILRTDTPAVSEAMRTKQPVLLQRAQAAELDLMPGAHGAAVVPVVSGNRTLGVLVVASDEHSFNEEQLQSLLMLTAQLGSGLEDVRLRRDLVESDRRFRSLYAALGCGVVVHDAKGAVVDVNWAAGHILGTSAEALRERPPFGQGWRVLLEDGTELPTSLRPPASVANFERPIRNLTANVVRPDGRRVLLRIDSTGIEEHGKLQWIVTSFFELSPARAEPRQKSRSSRTRA